MIHLLSRYSILMLLLAALIAGCGGGGASSPAAPSAAAPTDAAPTAMPTSEPASVTPAPNDSTGAVATAPAATSGTVTLVVVPGQSKASYRVREQLAGVSLPSDAVGTTSAITGTIVGNMDGTIVSSASKFVVDVRTLQSDQGMRDGFIQRTPLQTSQYPYVTFVPTLAKGLPSTPPASGDSSFQLVGDLTIRDVTRPTTWDATCRMTSQTEGTCTASTSFTFADFQLEQPRVGRVLSIEDTIKLEVEVALRRNQ